MKKTLLFTILATLAFISFAKDSTNGDNARKNIEINQTVPPQNHLLESAANDLEPAAFYNTMTATLSIELDPVYYSHYTIVIQSDYACVDYYATSPVVNIPVGSLDSVIDIYIESDDCGCYYGTLNQAAYGNTF